MNFYEKRGKWRAEMRYKKKKCLLGSITSDLAAAIRRRLLAEKALARSPDKNPAELFPKIATTHAAKRAKRKAFYMHPAGLSHARSPKQLRRVRDFRRLTREVADLPMQPWMQTWTAGLVFTAG